MRICLINPGKVYFTGMPPLGLAYLTSYLRKHSESNHKIKIIDENTKDDVEKEILNFKPDIIGVTATTPQIIDAQRVSQAIRKHFPDIPLIIGGAHVSSFPQEKALYDYFDIGIIGEGEVTFLDLVNLFGKNGELNPEDLTEIKGLAFKNNGEIFFTESRPLIKNLDEIPFPARELLKMEKFYLKPKDVVRGVVKRSTHIMSSRGCPYNCIFCSSHKAFGRMFRYHSPEYVINEIQHLVDVYKIEALFFQDDTFFIDKNRTKKICELMIEKGLNKIIWSAQLRANLITEKDVELLKLMKIAGCVQAEFGFESGSGRVLKLLKSNSVTVGDNQRAINVCKKVGLRILGNFMIGTVTETEKEIDETKQFILKNKNLIDYISVHITTPYPGTMLWDMCKEKGLLDNFSWKDFWMGEPHGKGYFSDVVSSENLIKFQREMNSIAYDNLSKSLLIRTAIRRPVSAIKMLLPYISFKIKSLRSQN